MDGDKEQKIIPAEFPNASRRAREGKGRVAPEPPPKPEAAEGIAHVVIRKKSILDRISNFVFNGETPREALGYAFKEVMVPAVKGALFDFLMGGLERRFGPRVRDAKRYTIDYSRMFRGPGEREDVRLRSGPDFGDIIFRTRDEAVEVLGGLNNYIVQYNLVTVADFYQMINQPIDYTWEKYGWSSLRNAYVKPVPGGYSLALPRPRPVEEL